MNTTSIHPGTSTVRHYVAKTCLGSIFAFSLLTVPAALHAQYTYATNDDSSVTITGYSGSEIELQIPEALNGRRVTSIGQDAFNGAGFTRVTVPSSVTNIGYGAFSDCIALTSVTLPASVNALGWAVFAGCTTLTNIFADSLNPVFSSVDGVLFNKSRDTLLAYPAGRRGSYVVPNGVTELGFWAFDSCPGLTDVLIPESVMYIDPDAFQYCTGLTRITIPQGATTLSTRAFYGCSGLTNAEIADSVQFMDCSIFADCTSLKTVTIGGGLKSLGLCEGGLGSRRAVFDECTNLSSIYFAGDAPDVGHVFGDNNTNATVYYLPGAKGWRSTFDGRPAVPVAADPPIISSLSSTTNGLTLEWQDTNTFTGYRVQIESSISGTWQDAPMRYRWPWPFRHWTDAASTLKAPRFYRVKAEPFAVAARGALLTNGVIRQLSTNQIHSLMVNFSGFDFKSFAPKNPVTITRFSYQTVDPFGLPTVASGLLMIPTGVVKALPLVSYQHSGLFASRSAPSLANGSGSQDHDYLAPLTLAASGFATVVSDFLGFGASPGYQFFHHAQSESTAVVDALRAARTICASNQVELNGQLFLYGYSEGGHATMAAHRQLEASLSNDLVVTASAPAAGAYDQGGVYLNSLLTNQVGTVQLFFPVQLAGYLSINDLASTLEDLLSEPYRTRLPPLLVPNMSDAQFNTFVGLMPAHTNILTILRADLYADIRTNANNVLREAMRENNTYNWTPAAPMKILHSHGDDVIVFANAEVAYRSFTNRGACCVELVDPGAPKVLDHQSNFIPSLRAALDWFTSLKK